MSHTIRNHIVYPGLFKSSNRFLSSQSEELQSSLDLILSQLLELDDFCQGAGRPHPLYAKHLSMLERGEVPDSWKKLLPVPAGYVSVPSTELQLWLDFITTRAREVEKAANAGSRVLSIGPYRIEFSTKTANCESN